ncbi:MAG: hypothetical protein ACRDNF_26310 [Streptosporangiaceae bacterium]
MASPPTPQGTALSGVTPDGEARAVGTPFTDTGRDVVLHWTGHAWVAAATPRTGGSVMLDGVFAVNSGDVRAVGTAAAGSGPYRAYALHWAGHRWVLAAVPDRGQGDKARGFESVAGLRHGRMVAVGGAIGAGAPGGALYGVWSGRSWSVSTGPRTDVDLGAVSFDGRHAVWAASLRPPGQARREI